MSIKSKVLAAAATLTLVSGVGVAASADQQDRSGQLVRVLIGPP